MRSICSTRAVRYPIPILFDLRALPALPLPPHLRNANASPGSSSSRSMYSHWL
jgi:hypothetical protein